LLYTEKNHKYLVLPAIILILVIAIYPIIFQIYLSLHRYALGFPWSTRVYQGIKNYINILTSDSFLNSLKLTIAFTLIVTILSLVVGLSIAIIVNRDFKYKTLIVTSILIPQSISPAIVGLVWKLMYNTEYGIFNYFLKPFGLEIVWLGSKFSFISVIITSVWLASSFMTLVTLAGLQNLPVDVFDAGKIDGANNYQMFRHITIPLLKPVVGIAVLLQQVACFHVFSTIFIMTGGGPGEKTNVLALEIYRKGIESGLASYAAGVATILVLVALFTSFLFLKIMGQEFE
jgi:multiple sugar transport system permease protein